jgi:protein-tyrosine-phosphatase
MSQSKRLRILFLCTGNSARSQIAEALVTARRDPRLDAGSAGTRPAQEVNAFAIAELQRRGIDWSSAKPKKVEEVLDDNWDIVITVCDAAREACPILPGQPSTAHWGVPDPALVEGDEQTKQRAFRDAALVLARRVDLLMALPLEKLEAFALERHLRDIGRAGGDV